MLSESNVSQYPLNGENNGFVFRKFINAAIYVEKKISNKYNQDEENFGFKITKTKRCSCYVNPNKCSCHPRLSKPDNKRTLKELDKKIELEKKRLKEKIQERIRKTRPRSISRLQPSLIDKKDHEINNRALQTDPLEDDLSLNIPNESDDSTSSLNSNLITVKRCDKFATNGSKGSLTTFQGSDNESVRRWLYQKSEEKRKEREKMAKLREQEEVEKQKLLEKERENFRLWLKNKKKEEEHKKIEMERQMELQKLKELEREKRHLQNEINFQMWLKQKEHAMLAKKKHQQIKELEARIEKEQRLMQNQDAFQAWLESSKNKPKPLPLNRGLDSLRSSMSITYVNPIPWVPNIEKKPYSQ